MFSLKQVDDRIQVLVRAAVDLEGKAEKQTHFMTQSTLRSYAEGLRMAADVFGRMIADEVEREAREAMRP